MGTDNTKETKLYVARVAKDGTVAFDTLEPLTEVDLNCEADLNDEKRIAWCITNFNDAIPFVIKKDIKENLDKADDYFRHCISQIEIINDKNGDPKVTKVKFASAPEPVKVVLQPGDTFSLYDGVLYCMTKHLFGKDIEPEFLERFARNQVQPFKIYNREIKRAIKAYQKEQKWLEEEEEDEKEFKRIEANKAAKRERYKVRRREKRIEEQAEAFKRAFADKNITIVEDPAVKAPKKKRKLFSAE